MCLRPITALLAALALLAVAPAASFAQTPTPTPTASTSQDDGEAEPPSDASKEVKAIYTDYSRDGVIDFCDHERTDLQEALDTIEADFDRDFPDFREALEAGLRDDDCEAEATPTPTATATPDDSTADPTATPDTGTLPDPDTGTDDGSGALPPDDGTLPPDDGGALPEEGALPEAGTEQPPAAAAPTAAPPAAATTPAPNPTPAIVTRSGTDALMIPGILIGVALLGAAALAFSAFRGGNPRVQHAWSEARYRTRSTWADFSDWLKLGR